MRSRSSFGADVICRRVISGMLYHELSGVPDAADAPNVRGCASFFHAAMPHTWPGFDDDDDDEGAIHEEEATHLCVTERALVGAPPCVDHRRPAGDVVFPEVFPEDFFGVNPYDEAIAQKEEAEAALAQLQEQLVAERREAAKEAAEAAERLAAATAEAWAKATEAARANDAQRLSADLTPPLVIAPLERTPPSPVTSPEPPQHIALLPPSSLSADGEDGQSGVAGAHDREPGGRASSGFIQQLSSRLSWRSPGGPGGPRRSTARGKSSEVEGRRTARARSAGDAVGAAASTEEADGGDASTDRLATPTELRNFGGGHSSKLMMTDPAAVRVSFAELPVHMEDSSPREAAHERSVGAQNTTSAVPVTKPPSPFYDLHDSSAGDAAYAKLGAFTPQTDLTAKTNLTHVPRTDTLYSEMPMTAA